MTAMFSESVLVVDFDTFNNTGKALKTVFVDEVNEIRAERLKPSEETKKEAEEEVGGDD